MFVILEYSVLSYGLSPLSVGASYQILTHTSCLSGQMDVISHSTLQLLSPLQLVARTSQNLHSLDNFIMLASEKEKKKELNNKALEEPANLFEKLQLIIS